MSETQVVNDVFSQAEDRARQEETMSVGDLLDVFGRRAYGPVLALVGIIAASPLGAIPGASILFATIVIVIAVQYAVRDRPPWLPQSLSRRAADGQRVQKALDRMKPYARKLEVVLAERQTNLTKSPWTYLWAAVLVALSIAMYPLALVPAGVTAPALAIALMGLAITAKDGRALAISGALGVAATIAVAMTLN